MPKSRRPDTLTPKIKTAQVLFYINTFVWFCLCIYLVGFMLYQNNGISSVFVGFFLFMNAALMFFCGRIFDHKETWIYYFSLAILIFNGLVTRIGQFGFFDQIELIFDIGILVFLISFGKAYLKKS